MKKPNNYDNTQGAGEYIPLELGGHIMVIKQIEETKSSTGKDMLKISLDTAPEDSQPEYFNEQFKNDTRSEKKWGCIVYQLVYDSKGDTSRSFKGFTTSVEKSNTGYRIPWGDGFANSFKDKRVGAVFGKEQYLNAEKKERMATKCFYFRSVEIIKKGVEIPAEHLLDNRPQYPKGYTTAGNGFMKIPDGVEDEGLPFN